MDSREETCGLTSQGTADEDTFAYGDILGHDWSPWQTTGSDTHTRICSRDASHKIGRAHV